MAAQFEVSVCVFKRGEFRMDDCLICRGTRLFETSQDVAEWADEAGVKLE